MTLVFDEKARNEFLNRNDYKELEYNGIKVNEMVVKQITVKEARPYISTFHYSKSTPDSTRFVFAGYYKQKLAGIVCFGMGSNEKQYSYLIPDIQKGEYVELTRLWSPDSMPRNTESKLISEALKQLPKEIKLVVSFADEQQKHVGYIYQATNWFYCGMTNGGKMLIDENGIVRHTKSINIYRLRHNELKNKSTKEIMELYGWKHIEGGKKHRYCYLLGKKQEVKRMKKMIEHKLMPYPKQNNNAL